MTTDDDQAASPRFGPFASLRALTDLQMQGIRAASQMAERFTAMLEDVAPPRDGTSPPAPPERPPAGSGNGAAGPAPDAELASEMRASAGRLIDLYSQIFERMLDAYLGLVGQMRAGPRIDAGADDHVRIDAVPGEAGTGDLWIHQREGATVPCVTLRATPLTSASGATIGPEQVRLDPGVVDLRPSATAHVALAVTVPATSPPGLYHGLVLAPELPDQTLRVTLHVADDGVEAT